jgi:hypothetical protein
VTASHYCLVALILGYVLGTQTGEYDINYLHACMAVLISDMEAIASKFHQITQNITDIAYYRRLCTSPEAGLQGATPAASMYDAHLTLCQGLLQLPVVLSELSILITKGFLSLSQRYLLAMKLICVSFEGVSLG